jgi:hypothetical protein
MNNNKTYRRILIVCVGVLLLMALLLAYYGEVNGCNGGKCSSPLPTQAQTRACDGPGVGPVHKCQPATPTPSPVPSIVVATIEKVQPVATATRAAPTSRPVAQPTSEPTSQPTATEVASEPACSEPDECSPCAIVQDAMDRGMVVIIADRDHVSISDTSIVVVKGD